jgi:glutamyl-tRNA reductase
VPLVCLGISHQTAPVDVRERHAFPASTVGETLVALKDYPAVREALILQTCGRLEIYAELEDYASGVDQLRSFLSNFRHGDVDDMDAYLYTLLGSQAVEHLFRVTTGLDSMLIGEAEILGQVKDAYVQAHRSQTLGTSLHMLFREALAAGKEARTRTKIADDSTSIATAAVDAAIAHVGELRERTVLLVGAGRMGTIAARRLHDGGAQRLVVLNRSQRRAADLAGSLTGSVSSGGLPEIADALADADIVITSTGASHFVVTADDVRAALARRPQRPLFFVDIAVPRDVDPDVAGIDGVGLLDVDGLHAAVAMTIERRREAIPQVEAIIARHAERFARWYRSRIAVPIITSLVQKAETIRDGELARLLGRLPELDERQRTLITGMTMTIVSKLLHGPVTRIREKAIENGAGAITHARMLDELFELRTLPADAETTCVQTTLDEGVE